MREVSRMRVLIAMIVLSLTACSTATVTKKTTVRTFGVQAPTATSNAYADIPVVLEDRDWRLVQLGSESVMKADKDITLRLSQGRAVGYGGCNQYNGSYKYDGNRFVFARIVASALTCVVTSTQEQQMFKSLQQTRYWQLDRQKQTLRFLDKKQQVLLEYQMVSNKVPVK